MWAFLVDSFVLAAGAAVVLLFAVVAGPPGVILKRRFPGEPDFISFGLRLGLEKV
jgi:hypothetical protein